MTTKVAIIGLGIMGQRMLIHMRLHHDFEPDYLWDPDESTCHQAIILDPQSKVMDSASDAISKADLVYLACRSGGGQSPVSRKTVWHQS